ncbi:Gti1/Pac2 family-domain-containing protein [Catenaria anguillulae PL171]|uniref:Gti1/Pac2 family-domain-containing protein n=1 Tax=Catenaria anguillulae PL171 TaxID=765915 RepID=A0A1Y2I2A5_9FUNG|nr:Gti1/Pac2 family-domain-containing protein [Catenaria anguillulae PL171]
MTDQNCADIASLETFFGAITNIDDALLLVEAVRLGTARRLRRRLTENQQLLIRSGSVFVWNESEAKIKRWTDGRHWSNSRMKGRFFLYKELATSKKTGTARAHVASLVAAASTSKSTIEGFTSAKTTTTTVADSVTSASPITLQATPSNPDGMDLRAAPSQTDSNLLSIPVATDRLFLRKKTISFQTRQGEKYHLIAYYTGQSEASMPRPSQAAEFSELVIEPGFYFTESPTASPAFFPSSPSAGAGQTQHSSSPSLSASSQANLPNAVEEPSTVPVPPSIHTAHSWHHATYQETRLGYVDDGMRHRDYPQYDDRSRWSHALPVSHPISPHIPHISPYGWCTHFGRTASFMSWHWHLHPSTAHYRPTAVASHPQFSTSPLVSHPVTAPFAYSEQPSSAASVRYQVASPAPAYSAASSYFPPPVSGDYPRPPRSECLRTVDSNRERQGTPAIEVQGQTESKGRSEAGLTVVQRMTEEEDMS